MDGSLDRLCDPPGRVFSDSESRTASKSAQENPLSSKCGKIHYHERADEKILKAQSSATTEKCKVAAADQACCLQSGILFTGRYK